MTTKMTDDEANELRLYANEICRRLWEAGQEDQLKILHHYIEVALQTKKAK